MQDWVIDYFKREVGALSDKRFKEIREVNFDCLDSEHPDRRTFLNISDILINRLKCNFGPEKSHRSQIEENFAISFGSVLADLPENRFDELHKKKSVFYHYKPDFLPGYVTTWKLDDGLVVEKGKEVRLVTFTCKFSPEERLLSRHSIIHELLHILEPTASEKRVNEVIRELGFNSEVEAANEYERKKKAGLFKKVERGGD